MWSIVPLEVQKVFLLFRIALIKLKGTGWECRRVECESAKLWGEIVKELSDGVTETQILQNLWKK